MSFKWVSVHCSAFPGSSLIFTVQDGVPALRQRKLEGQRGSLKCSHRPFLYPHHLEPSPVSSSFRGSPNPQEETQGGRGRGLGWGGWRVVEAPCGDSSGTQPIPRDTCLSEFLSQEGRHAYRVHKSLRPAGVECTRPRRWNRNGPHRTVSPWLSLWLSPSASCCGQELYPRLLSRSASSASPCTGHLCGRSCQYGLLIREGQTQPLCCHGHHVAHAHPAAGCSCSSLTGKHGHNPA